MVTTENTENTEGWCNMSIPSFDYRHGGAVAVLMPVSPATRKKSLSDAGETGMSDGLASGQAHIEGLPRHTE